MFKSQRSFVVVASMLMGITACGQNVPAPTTNSPKTADFDAQPGKELITKMKIKIGSKTFTATLADTKAAAKLKAKENSGSIAADRLLANDREWKSNFKQPLNG
jgi:hypothetical protein